MSTMSDEIQTDQTSNTPEISGQNKPLVKVFESKDWETKMPIRELGVMFVHAEVDADKERKLEEKLKEQAGERFASISFVKISRTAGLDSQGLPPVLLCVLKPNS